MDIYYSPHISHQAEAAFFETFRQRFPSANFLKECYRVEEDYLSKFVHTHTLLDSLVQDGYLPNNRKQQCIEALNECPPQLKVTPNPAEISFDVVITTDEETYYWEFHENQHRNWKCGRDSSIYNGATGVAITVPRYVQRLVRDVWRLEHFRPYTIVWKDWFEANQNKYNVELQSGLHEYSLSQEFSFRNFYNL